LKLSLNGLLFGGFNQNAPIKIGIEAPLIVRLVAEYDIALMHLEAQMAKPESESQLDKFKEAARELECDDDPEAFKKRLGKLVKREGKEPQERN